VHISRNSLLLASVSKNKKKKFYIFRITEYSNESKALEITTVLLLTGYGIEWGHCAFSRGVPINVHCAP